MANINYWCVRQLPLALLYLSSIVSIWVKWYLSVYRWHVDHIAALTLHSDRLICSCVSLRHQALPLGETGVKSHRGKKSEYIFSVIFAAIGVKFVNLATLTVNFFVGLATEVKPLPLWFYCQPVTENLSKVKIEILENL